VCAFVCICIMFTNICKYLCAFVDICMQLCNIYVYLCAFLSACFCICVHLRVFVCVYIYLSPSRINTGAAYRPLRDKCRRAVEHMYRLPRWPTTQSPQQRRRRPKRRRRQGVSTGTYRADACHQYRHRHLSRAGTWPPRETRPCPAPAK
jgi:hypothetical protein